MKDSRGQLGLFPSVHAPAPLLSSQFTFERVTVMDSFSFAPDLREVEEGSRFRSHLWLPLQFTWPASAAFPLLVRCADQGLPAHQAGPLHLLESTRRPQPCPLPLLLWFPPCLGH